MSITIRAECRCVRCEVNFCDRPLACPFCGAPVTSVPALILRPIGSFHAVTALTDRAQDFLDRDAGVVRGGDGVRLIPADRFSSVFAELLEGRFNVEFGKRIPCAA